MSEPTKAVAVRDARPAAAVTHYNARPLIVAAVLEEESEQRQLLGQYIARHMQEGTDYGVIPGTERKNADGSPAPSPKTLFKSGAEKLTTLFRCIPRFVVEDKIEDWETGLFYYRLSCQIVTQADGTVVAEGVGSCSTYESRYRWRKADRKCPSCGAAAIKRSKYPPRSAPKAQPGWYCYDKAGGCGANFDDASDPAITSQPLGRTQNPDILDAVNTVLKMAKKRAHVDATITLARCSDIFTQDVEDFLPPDEPEKPRQPAANTATAAAPPKREQPAPKPAAREREPGEDDDVEEGEITGPETGNPVGGFVPASEPKRRAIMNKLGDLNKGWRDAKTREQVTAIIGRELPPDATTEAISETEADLLIVELDAALKTKAEKAAARAAKKDAVPA